MVSCSIYDKFAGEFEVDAEVLNIGKRILSIKYQIGSSELYDDLNMKDNTALMFEWRNRKAKTIPLKVVIEGGNDDFSGSHFTITYYYKSNLISTSSGFDYASVYMIAKDNGSMFNWEWRDEKKVEEGEVKEESAEDVKKKSSPVVQKEEKGNTLW